MHRDTHDRGCFAREAWCALGYAPAVLRFRSGGMRVASSMLVLAAAMALPVGARAADADTMSVTGAITAHNGCSMSIQNGGNINFGVVTTASIPWGRYSHDNLDASVNCTTPTYVAIQLIDMRSGAGGGSGADQLGLGIARNGMRVGYYTVGVHVAVTLNGLTGYMLGDPSPGPGIGAFWVHRSIDPWRDLTWRSFGYTTGGTAAEEPVSAANFTLFIDTYLTPPEELELTGAQPIDGQFILEMMYM